MKLKELIPLLRGEFTIKKFNEEKYDFEYTTYCVPDHNDNLEAINNIIKNIGEYEIVKIMSFDYRETHSYETTKSLTIVIK